MNLVRVLKGHEAIIKGDDPLRRTIYNPDQINFSKAINTVDEESCFKLSGSKLILDYLRQRLGENTSMIIDFSAMPSIFRNDQKLADFITVYDPMSAFTSEPDKAYNHVYGVLKEKGIGLFYKSDFFKKPQLPVYYYSTYDYDKNMNEADNRKQNKAFIDLFDQPDKNYSPKGLEFWPIIRYGNTIFKFKNKSFPLSYENFEELIKNNPNSMINCQIRNTILLQFYNQYFLNEVSRQEHEKHSHLLSIPLIGYPGNEDNENSCYEGLGAIFVYFISDSANELFFKRIVNDLWFIGLQITYNTLNQIASDLFITSRNEAIKSAKAAIMSRNMSHNLGSHVMSYLKMHLGSVSNILRDHVLSTLLESEDLDTLRNHALVADELTLPFLVGIGRFISYLQERQDFIATVSTDFVPYYSSVNFKDFIFDELNCDKRYDRHPKRTNQKPDNILLGNIARSEGLGRQTSPTKGDSTLNDIVLKFRTTFDGSPISKIKVQKEVQNDPEPIDIAAKELEEMRHYELSLPGGVIGRQAIFSIIENVIRNAAKHGNWRDQGQLELSIDIFSKDEVMNPVKEVLTNRLRDDRATEGSLSLQDVLKTFYCNNERSADDYFFITLTDNLYFSNTSLQLLRKALIEGYIDEEGKMINTNKGIKEMRISAAWLRSISNDTMLSPFNDNNVNIEGERLWPKEDQTWNSPKPPILYARRSKGIDGICHLQYIFCVMRPKKVAFISPLFENYTNESFQKQSWDLLSPTEYIYNRENKNYEFVIFDDTENISDQENVFKDVRRRSSNRFFILSNLSNCFEIFKRIKESQNCDKKSLDKAYISLYNYLSGLNQTDIIYIIDDKDDAESTSHYSGDSISKKSNRIIPQKTYIGGKNVKYRYQYHLEDKKEFQKYVIKYDSDPDSNPNLKTCKFSEGISGDNSTDRLVRNEPKTELWFYKHLHAMNHRIAIFDERLFSKVTGLDESDFVSPTSFWKQDLNKAKEYLKAQPVFDDFNDTEKRAIDKYSTYEPLEKFMNRKHVKLPECSDLVNQYSQNHLGATFKYKNLNVFSIIRSVENPKRFNLYGIKIDKSMPAFSQCVRYATLRWDSSNKRLIIENDAKQKTDWMKFHSLSIHQGLLDKLYNAFGIKKDDIEAKENLTKDFYEHFVIDATAKKIWFTDKRNRQRYFLPGMTIHSGRSKPSKEDMPQQLPFIPYSAIEQAVLDCKYSIVNLLDSARYE